MAPYSLLWLPNMTRAPKFDRCSIVWGIFPQQQFWVVPSFPACVSWAARDRGSISFRDIVQPEGPVLCATAVQSSVQEKQNKVALPVELVNSLQ